MQAPIIAQIQAEKKRLNAVILAHYYQEAAIQELADFVGDSLALAQFSQKSDAKTIVLCGVKFMAETAKILNPEKLVLLPDLDAGCSLADSCSVDEFSQFKTKFNQPYVVMYINSNIEIKALSDVIITSSNAEKIIRNLPDNRPILFGPDRHLGAYLSKKTGRSMTLWQGACIVHETFNLQKLLELKLAHPKAKIIAHPECDENILAEADYIGSTSKLLEYSRDNSANEFIVLTESGIIHQMQKASPHKTFIEGPNNEGCACNECPYMRLNTLEKLLKCMQEQSPAIEIEESLRQQALVPLNRMLELS